MQPLSSGPDKAINDKLLQALLWAAAVVLAAAYLAWPYGWDQGIYVWMAQEIRAGGVPYSDVWDVKGPGAIYLVALAQVVFGDSPLALRAFDLCVFGIGVAITYKLSMLLFESRQGARLAAGLLVLWYLSLRYWHTAQPDGWGTVMLLGATWLVLTSNKTISILIAGALVGFSSSVKPQFILFAIPMLLLAGTRRPATNVTQLIGLGFAGAIVPILALIAILARNDALQDAIQTYLMYAPLVYAPAAGSLGDVARQGIDWLFGGSFPTALFAVALVGWCKLQSQQKVRAQALALWILGALALVALQRWFFGYHVIPAMPWICILGAHGIVTLVQLWRESPRNSDRRLTIGALTFALLLSLVTHFGVFAGYDVLRTWAHIGGILDQDAYLDGMGKPGDDYRLSRYLSANTEQSDRILVWGMHTTALAISQRRSWSRFGFNMALTIDTKHPISQRWRSEFRNAFAHSRPDFIVFGEGHTAAPNLNNDPLTCSLRVLAKSDYVHRFSTGPIDVFERREAGAENLEPLAMHEC